MDLPIEVIYPILFDLDYQDIFNYCLSCRETLNILDDYYFWKIKIKRLYLDNIYLHKSKSFLLFVIDSDNLRKIIRYINIIRPSKDKLMVALEYTVKTNKNNSMLFLYETIEYLDDENLFKLACQHKNIDMINLLNAKGFLITDDILIKIFKSKPIKLEFITYLINTYHFNLSTLNKCSKIMATQGNLDVIKLLLTRGVNDFQSITNMAIQHHHFNIVKYIKSIKQPST